MAGCNGCGQSGGIESEEPFEPSRFLIDPNGEPLRIPTNNTERSAEFPSSTFSIGKKFNIDINFDVAIFYASMATDLLLFPLKYKIEPCDCGKDKQLKAILENNKNIIEEVLEKL